MDSEPETIFELHKEQLAMPLSGATLASKQAFHQVLYGDLLQYSGVLHLDIFFGLMEGRSINIPPEDFYFGKFGHNFVILPFLIIDIS
jgi:hypothetical protein